jgi:hypothetical protein
MFEKVNDDQLRYSIAPFVLDDGRTVCECDHGVAQHGLCSVKYLLCKM